MFAGHSFPLVLWAVIARLCLCVSFGEDQLSVDDFLKLPVWRSDRFLTRDEWYSLGKCAYRFQMASEETRKDAVAEYMRIRRNQGGTLTEDGAGTFDSKIYLLLRVTYQIELLGAKAVYPFAAENKILALREVSRWGLDVYNPETDFKRFARFGRFRDLTKWKFKIGKDVFPFAPQIYAD